MTYIEEMLNRVFPADCNLSSMPKTAFVQAFIRAAESANDLETTIAFFSNRIDLPKARHHINDTHDHLSLAVTYYNSNSIDKIPANLDEWRTYVGTFCNEFSETHSFFLILALIFVIHSHFDRPVVWILMRYYAFKIVIERSWYPSSCMIVSTRAPPEECVVCYENTYNVTSICRHRVCSACQDRVVTCPYCRRVLHPHLNAYIRVSILVRDLLFYSPLYPCCYVKGIFAFCPYRFYRKNIYVRESVEFRQLIKKNVC